MRRLGEELLTLAVLGILASFLSLLFVASVRGRTDGRKIPFPSVLGESAATFRLSPDAWQHVEHGGFRLVRQPTDKLCSRGNLRLGSHDHRRIDLRAPVGCCFSDDTQAGSLTAVTEGTIVQMVSGDDNDHDHDMATMRVTVMTTVMAKRCRF